MSHGAKRITGGGSEQTEFVHWLIDREYRSVARSHGDGDWVELQVRSSLFSNKNEPAPPRRARQVPRGVTGVRRVRTLSGSLEHQAEQLFNARGITQLQCLADFVDDGVH